MSEQSVYNFRNREVICRVLLFSTYLVIAAISLLLLLRFGTNHDLHLLGRLLVCAVALVYALVTHFLLYLKRHRSVAYLLTLFYGLLAFGIIWSWGIDTPIGTLILSLVVVLAGILLTARHALFAAVFASLVLTVVQTASALNWHKPDVSWSGSTTNFGDVVAYSIVFGMLAVVSWLYNREIERSLARAKQAEIALLGQKATLKLQVEERTAELRQAQLEEMKYMYRFAELGQLGVILLHELANHLTALTLEIESMQNKRQTKSIARAQQIIHYLEKIVDSTRDRLHGTTEQQTFNLCRKINEAVEFLQDKAAKNRVTVDWQPPEGQWQYTGDPTCLNQAIAIILSNAIDAYGNSAETSASGSRRVAVMLSQNASHTAITISDWGKGITKAQRRRLFKPFHSTKKSGLGLGLFMAKQTIETTFSGTIILSPQTDHTQFIIKLPLQNGN
ncbi:MAG TPA: HAMP domain-containing sensor histidine kinase [Candidatus Acidoferrum sp.]|nr:HAMP domain-containing sensor histidine kinase [Candidatus Acidoferrum sp.]